MKHYVAADGTRWNVEVALPGSSNAMVLFRHPAGGTRRMDRYNWFISHAPEARSVTTRLSPKKVAEGLTEPQLARLFLRSMPIQRPRSEAPEPALG